MPTLDARTSWSAESLIGRVFSDRYQIVRHVGEGGGWGVFLAQHLLTHRDVALRLHLDELPSKRVDEFLEEARTVARIGHENVTDILHGARSPDGYVFLATEYLEGRTLAQALRDQGPLPWPRARPIVLQIAAALGAMHPHGIIHGDLRPAKVFLIERNGQRDFVKLLDLGLAKLTPGGDLLETGEGSISGPPHYVAPEQVHGGRGDRRADIYALACVTYEMLTGQPPFYAGSFVEVLGKHVSEPPAPPSTKRPDLAFTPEVEAAVMRGLEKDPDRRWQDMAAFAEALERHSVTRRTPTRAERAPVASGPATAENTPSPQRSRGGRKLFAALTLGGMLVAAGAAWRTFVMAPGHIRISTIPADATVTFNDVPVAVPSPVLLDVPAGHHAVSVARPGFVSVRRVVEIFPRRTLEVPVQLEPAPGAAPDRPNEHTAGLGDQDQDHPGVGWTRPGSP